MTERMFQINSTVALCVLFYRCSTVISHQLPLHGHWTVDNQTLSYFFLNILLFSAVHVNSVLLLPAYFHLVFSQLSASIRYETKKTWYSSFLSLLLVSFLSISFAIYISLSICSIVHRKHFGTHHCSCFGELEFRLIVWSFSR